MLPLVIIGRADIPSYAPEIDLAGKDVWAFNTGAKDYPVTAAFDMHIPFHILENKRHYEWLKALTVPVYMRKRYDEFPTSIAYPFDDIYKMTGSLRQGMFELEEIKYFTSSISYALALAILQERPQLDIYGVELEDKTEYEHQRECYLFWVGFAASRIPVNIHCGDRIFRKPLYGEESG